MSDARAWMRLRRIAGLAGALAFALLLTVGTTVVGAVSMPASVSGAITAMPRLASNCSPSPTPNPSPSPSASAGASPAASPSPSASASPAASPSASPSPSSSSSPGPSPSPSPTATSISCNALSVTPNSGLADGQYVKLTFVNLQPGQGIVFRQCTAGWASVSTDCTPINTRLLGVVDQNGGGDMYFPVYAYANDKLKNAGGIPIPCDARHACAIVGYSGSHDAAGNYQHTYQTDITFALSADACPPVGPDTVGGSGSAAAYRAMFRWIAARCLPPAALPVTYISSNDHAAYVDASKGSTVNGGSEFGVTGLGPYPPAGVSGGPAYKLAPLTASAVVLAYRAYDILPDGSRGSQITNLTLTPDLIAQLFMGQLNNFNVRTVTALNPGITFPPRTQVAVRAEFNSETYILTSWLKAVSPSIWKPPTSPSPDIFPATLTSGSLFFGERAAALNIVDPSTGFDQSVVYIGALDSTTAAFYGLPTVKIKMPDGSVLSANTTSILKAISDTAQLADGTLQPQWANFADPAAWPMPNITYMLAPTSKIDPALGKTLAAFLKYAVQDGQKLVTGDDGYVALPTTLVADSLVIADQIPAPPPPASPIPSPTPVPPPSLPPLPPLPPLPSAPVDTGGSATTGASGACSSGSQCTGAGGAASNSRVATLSYSQGAELITVAHQQLAMPPQYALPSLLGLTVLITLVGLGLQAWALWVRPAGPPPQA